MVEHYGEADKNNFHPSGEDTESCEIHNAVLDPVKNTPPVFPFRK
jgi:hypothetical protein